MFLRVRLDIRRVARHGRRYCRLAVWYILLALITGHSYISTRECLATSNEFLISSTGEVAADMSEYRHFRDITIF